MGVYLDITTVAPPTTALVTIPPYTGPGGRGNLKFINIKMSHPVVSYRLFEKLPKNHPQFENFFDVELMNRVWHFC